jgi:hypothetical protein
VLMHRDASEISRFNDVSAKVLNPSTEDCFHLVFWGLPSSCAMQDGGFFKSLQMSTVKIKEDCFHLVFWGFSRSNVNLDGFFIVIVATIFY